MLRRLEQEQHAQAWGSRGGPSAADVCASLEIPKPDMGPQCKAMIGICQAYTVWMAACTGTMQRVAELGKQGTGNGIHAHQLSVEVKSSPLLKRSANMHCKVQLASRLLMLVYSAM